MSRTASGVALALRLTASLATAAVVCFAPAAASADAAADKATARQLAEVSTTDEVTSLPRFVNGGLGLMIDFPGKKVGAFGEADLLFERLQVSQEITHDPPLGAATSCDITRGYTGGGLRLGGGVTVRLASFFNLVPYASTTVGTFTDADVSGSCETGETIDYQYQTESSVHVTLALGVGGDFVFGGSRPQ